MTAHHPWLKNSPEKLAGPLKLVSFDAYGLYWAIEMHMCASGLDGQMPAAHLSVATERRLSQAKCSTLVAQLVDAGLVTVEGDLLHVVHWEQPPVDVWTDDVKRARWRRASALHNNRDLKQTIRERDRNLCRYCGVRVNWADRRGATSGTYDHIDPDGDNDVENVAVACRRCNGKKKDRTPEQAGMPLYRPGTTAQQIADGQASPIAASAVPARAPEPRARSGDPIGTESRSNRRAGSPRAPARDRNDSTLTESHLDRTKPPAGGDPDAPPPWTDEQVDGYVHPLNERLVQ